MTNTTTTITLQGIELKISRKGRGKPLLMLHGGGGPISSRPFADQLADHFEIIEPIHPGFSGTPIPSRFDSVEDLVYLYLDLIEALDLKDVTLLGHSLGGWIAAEIAVRNLSRVSRLVLADAIGIKPGGRDERDIPDIFAMSPDKVEALLWHDATYAPSEANRSDQDWQMMAANRVALGMYTWDPYMHNPKLMDRLHRITVPTLLLWGAHDRFVRPSYGQAYAQRIPGARLELIDDAGHVPHVEQPAAFVRHVLAFAD
jgi:pimeloyl-ACP methyl ester carboxylesterase